MIDSVDTQKQLDTDGLDTYAEAMRGIWRAERDRDDEFDAISYERAENQRKRDERGLWQKLISWHSFNKGQTALKERKQRAEKMFDSQLAELRRQQTEGLTAALNELISQSPRRAMIMDLQVAYATTRKLYDSHCKLVQAGERALREIREADSAVSSAQTIEVFDMMSSNKGISAMSTMSSMSASSEVDDAKRAVKRFAESLERHRATVEELQHDICIEYLDFGFDLLGLNNGFDFGSVLSLMSLSSTSSELDKAERKIREVMEPLRKARQQASEELDQIGTRYKEAKRSAFEPVLAMITRRGVPAPTDDFVNAFIEIYRIPSGAEA